MHKGKAGVKKWNQKRKFQYQRIKMRIDSSFAEAREHYTMCYVSNVVNKGLICRIHSLSSVKSKIMLRINLHTFIIVQWQPVFFLETLFFCQNINFPTLEKWWFNLK